MPARRARLAAAALLLATAVPVAAWVASPAGSQADPACRNPGSNAPACRTTPPPTSTPPPPTTTPPPADGGCPAYPAFPDGACTGWAHTGVTLRRVPADVTSGPGWHWEPSPFDYVKVDGDGAVLDGLDVSGCVFVDVGVTRATVSRSRVAGGCDYLVRLYDTSLPVALSVVDTELVGGAVQVKGAGFTWLRVDARGFTGKAAMMGSGTLVEDSWVHDPVCNPPDHQSGLGTNGGAAGVVIRHNTVDLPPSDCVSGGVANYDDFGAFHDVLVEGNLLDSGGFCLKAGFEDNNAAGNSGERVLGNTFGRKYGPECGDPYGVVSNWMPDVAGNEWAGNTWGDGAAATSAHVVGDPVIP